jgi:translocation and assembly module TamA
MDTVLLNHMKEAGYAFAASEDIDVLASRADATCRNHIHADPRTAG